MTDPKPYTPEELAKLDAQGWPSHGAGWHWGDALDPARFRATVQALAAARLVILECLNTDVAGELTEQGKDAAMAWLYPDAPPRDADGLDGRWGLWSAECHARGIVEDRHR